jgi:hypothetical protein
LPQLHIACADIINLSKERLCGVYSGKKMLVNLIECDFLDLWTDARKRQCSSFMEYFTALMTIFVPLSAVAN